MHAVVLLIDILPWGLDAVQIHKCLIWGTNCTRDERDYGRILDVHSPRTAGKYVTSDHFDAWLGTLADDVKLKLTTWLINKRLQGIEIPRIDSIAVERATSSRLLTPDERRDKLLLFIASQCPRLDNWYNFDLSPDSVNHDNYLTLLAITESVSYNELMRLINFSSEWIESKCLGSGCPDQLRIELKGWQRFEYLKDRQVASQQAFVAMWFDPSMQGAFNEGFYRGAEDAGYIAKRIDREQHNEKICDRIVAEIRRSRFVIADFTCAITMHDSHDVAIARGGVYYEAGFAHGLKIPVIFTCRSDALKHVHFDTRQFAHIEWEEPEDLRIKLADRISATIGDGPLKMPSNH